MNITKKFDIPPLYTMEMMKFATELEKTGRNVYHLEVGQPTANTPRPIIEKAEMMLKDGRVMYCPSLGLFELRESIARYYQDIYGIKIDPVRVVITPGTSIGLYVILLTNFSKGANIVIPSPSYPSYRNLAHALGYTVIDIPTNREENYLISIKNLEDLNISIDGLLIASPNNPTGSMYDAELLSNLAFYCSKNGITLICDELYHGITYESKAETALKFNENAIVINGFSKYFVMTGWRIGWFIAPEHTIGQYEKLLQNMLLCTSTLSQNAALAAFSVFEELNNNVQVYKRNRDLLYSSLSKTGLRDIYKPQGGFYLYIELDSLDLEEMSLCKELLYNQGVATAPGLDFVANSDRRAIRLSFSQSEDVICQAAIKLHSFFENK